MQNSVILASLVGIRRWWEVWKFDAFWHVFTGWRRSLG